VSEVEVLLSIVEIAFQVYSFLLFGYILSSWIPQLRDSQIGYFLARMVEPYLQPFRHVIPNYGMIDLSPIVAYFALFLAKDGVIITLQFIGEQYVRL
jgi:YggT family protein